MRLHKVGPYLLFAMAIAFATYVNLRIIAKEVDRLHEPGRTEEARYEERLRPLKEVLPRHAVVGYVTDEGADAQKKIKDFFLAEYMLAPRILVRGTHYPQVIGVYYEMVCPNRTASRDLILIRDFGHGIELYRGEQP